MRSGKCPWFSAFFFCFTFAIFLFVSLEAFLNFVLDRVSFCRSGCGTGTGLGVGVRADEFSWFFIFCFTFAMFCFAFLNVFL